MLFCCLVVLLFGCLVLAKASGRAERFGGFVILLYVSRADARDTGADGEERRVEETQGRRGEEG